MFPLSRVPFGYRFFEPRPFHEIDLLRNKELRIRPDDLGIITSSPGFLSVPFFGV